MLAEEIPIYQTELVKNQRVVAWPAFEVFERKIHAYLKFELYIFYESRVRKELVGEFKIAKKDIHRLSDTEH